MRRFFFGALAGITLLISACQSGSTNVSPPVSLATPTATPLTPVSTSIPLPTPMTAPTATPTAALIPTLTVLPESLPALPEDALARIGKGTLGDMAISPDGELLAVTTSVGLYLYRMDTLEQVWAKPSVSWMGSVEWSPDGRMLAAASGFPGAIVVWDVSSGERLHEFEDREAGSVAGIAWSPDSTTLAAVAPGSQAWFGTMSVWDAQTGEALFYPEFRGDFNSVAWSPDGEEIATGPSDYGPEETIVIWDAHSMTRKRVFEEPWIGAQDLVWSPDGKQLASASGGYVKIWDAAAGTGLHLITEDFASSSSVAWSPDGKQFLVGIGNSNFGSLAVRDTTTGELLGEFQGHAAQIDSVDWSSQGTTVVSSSGDGTIGLWDVNTRERLYTLQGYYERVNPAAWSAGSAFLAYGTSDEIVHVWDVSAGKVLRSFENPRGEDYFSPTGIVVWAPDRNILAIGGAQGVITLWNMETDGVSGLSGGRGGLTGLAWSPDGTRIAATSVEDFHQCWVAILDVETGENLLQIEFPEPIHVAWSPDSAYLAALTYVDEQWAIVIWDAVTGQQLKEIAYDGSDRLESDVVWSPDGTILASSSMNEGVLLWDVMTGEVLGSFQTDWRKFVESVAWSPDGRQLASGGGKEVVIWGTAEGNQLCTLEGHTSIVTDVAWSPDGALLASTSMDGTIVLWEMTRDDCQPTDTLPADTGPPSALDIPTPTPAPQTSPPLETPIDLAKGFIHDLALSPDGEFLALATVNGLYLLRARTSEQIWTKRAAQRSGIECVAFSPDGRMLASGESVDGQRSTITAWDTATGEFVGSQMLYLSGAVFDLSWSPDGTYVAAPEGGYVRSWDPVRGDMYMFGEAKRAVNSVDWSSDRTRFAAGEGNVVTLWDPRSWFIQNTLTGHTDEVSRVAWSPDGVTLASGSRDSTVILWDTTTNDILHILEGHTRLVEDIAWSPDGDMLASAAWDGKVILWDTLTGEIIRILEGHTSAVISLAWFPDGATLVSGSNGEEIIFWPID